MPNEPCLKGGVCDCFYLESGSPFVLYDIEAKGGVPSGTTSISINSASGQFCGKKASIVKFGVRPGARTNIAAYFATRFIDAPTTPSVTIYHRSSRTGSNKRSTTYAGKPAEECKNMPLSTHKRNIPSKTPVPGLESVCKNPKSRQMSGP